MKKCNTLIIYLLCSIMSKYNELVALNSFSSESHKKNHWSITLRLSNPFSELFTQGICTRDWKYLYACTPLSDYLKWLQFAGKLNVENLTKMFLSSSTEILCMAAWKSGYYSMQLFLHTHTNMYIYIRIQILSIF